jgi:hypothetical protein
METILKYFNDKFKNDTLTDKDRLFLVNLLYGDLNLIETLEEQLEEECFTNTDLIEIKKYINSQEIKS